MTVDIKLNVDGSAAKQSVDGVSGAIDRAKHKSAEAERSLADMMDSLKEGATNARDALDKIVDGVRAVAEGAAAHEQHTRAVMQLGSAYEQVRVATNDTVTAQDALKAQQSLAQSGMRVTGDQLAVIARKARDYALATGTDTVQALEQLTDALRGGEEDGLQRFGLAADATGNRVRGLRTNLHSMAEQQRLMTPAQRTMAEEIARTGVKWDEFKNQLMGSASQAVHLQTVLGGLANAVTKLGTAAGGVSTSAWRTVLSVAGGTLGIGARLLTDGAHLGNLTRNAGNAVLPGLGTSIAPRATAFADANAAAIAGAVPGAGNGEVSPSGIAVPPPTNGGGRSGSSPIAGLRHDLAALQTQALIAGAQVQVAHRLAGESAEQMLRRNAEMQRHSIELHRDRRREESATDAAYWQNVTRLSEEFEKNERDRIEALAKARDVLIAQGAQWDAQFAQAPIIAEHVRQLSASLASGATSVSAVQTELFNLREQNLAMAGAEDLTTQLRIAGNDRLIASLQGVLEAHQANTRAMRENADYSFQANKAFQGMAELHMTGAQAMGSVLASTYGAMTGALRSHIKALILGKETIGEALQGILHETLLSLATEAAVQAVMQTAIGIGKLAGSFGADPTAYGHFASAAAFAAVAGLAGVGAAATVPSAASAGAGASAGRAPGPAASAGSSPSMSNGGSNVTYVYQVNGNTYHREQSADEVASMMRDAMSRGTA